MNKSSIITIVGAVAVLGGIFIYSSVPHISNINLTSTDMTDQNLAAVGVAGSASSTSATSTELMAQNGDTVSVLYTGKLTNGKVFDASSLHGNAPISFELGAGRVIKGWDQGLVGMKIGEKKTLTISPENAYGSQAIPDGKGGALIPANSTLVFDVELVNIERE